MVLELTQKYFLGGNGGRFVGLTTLPPACADCLETWEPQPPGTLRVCKWDCFTIYYMTCRSQWPRGLRRRSAAARLLRLCWFESHRVGECLCVVIIVYYQVDVSAT